MEKPWLGLVPGSNLSEADVSVTKGLVGSWTTNT